MLDGKPRQQWQFSVVLRRILFPLLAYPFMKLGGFEPGGFVASVLIHLLALIALGLFLRRRYGDDSAAAGMMLLATYPGITYWAGLPYSYAAIVPASIGLFILLVRLEEQTTMTQVALIGLAMGIGFTAYDLAPFFAVAALGLLAVQRRSTPIPGILGGMTVAPRLSALLLPWRLY